MSMGDIAKSVGSAFGILIIAIISLGSIVFGILSWLVGAAIGILVFAVIVRWLFF